MKQKRKVKSLLPYKIDRDGTMLTILLLILSLVLCLWSASLMTVSVWAADDNTRGNYPMTYPWIDDRVEVLYWLQFSDRNRLWDEFVNQFFMKDKTLYLSPNQVKVKSNDSSFRDNTVDTWKYINVLWWENSKIKSDNITLIAWNWNTVVEWNDNASILGWEENKIKETSSWAPAVIAWWRENKIENNNSNVVIWWNYNNITNAENSVILWWETNTVNGGKNIIVWWSNVEVNGVDNVFVYSDSSTKFNPKSSNAFYLNLSDWVGINADAAKGWLSVSGAVGFGEIDIDSKTCNEDNIWVIWSWDGCLVWCTKASSPGTWELLDRWSICEDKCEKNSKCMFTPTENFRTGADYTAFCTGVVSTKHADRCTTWENQSYENVVFETVIIDVNEECPVSGHNKCVYRCNPGTTLTWGECHQNCTLIWDDEVIVPHGYHIGAYNATEAYCAKDTDSNFPDTCGKHRHEIVCYDGEWLLADNYWKPEKPNKKAKPTYIYESCQLGGYRCKTGTNYYNLKVSEITDKLQDDTNTPKNQNKSRVAKDRTTVNGRRWQYRICIDYDPAPKTYPSKTLNWDLCDTWTVTPQPPYHYKFIGCQTGDGYFPFTGQDWIVRCMQNCTLTGVNGIATGYRHNTSITGYMATGATCTGVCVSTKIVCNDGTWRLSKLTWEETTAFPYNDCVLSDKVCTWYDLNQSIYNQHHSNSVYDACVPYSGNGKFTCNKQVTGYKLTDCISGNHTEPGESWMKWCISNEKVVNCQTGDKDLLKYEYIITWVKITWSGSWNTWYWSEPKVCEWKCGKDFHLSGDYFSGWVCVSNTWSAPCKTWWAEWHVKYIEEDVVISWSGLWNTGSWTEPGNCRLTWCEAGWCGPNCLYTGADIQCKERTNLRSWEVNIIESSFVACGDEPEPCKLKCIEGYHTGDNWWCDPNIKREPCKQIDPTKLYDTSFMLEYLWTDWQWKLSNASGTECPIGDGTAMFEWGSGFNNHLREMAEFDGNDVPVVQIIEKVDNIPSWVTTKIVSAPESELPIYAWYDGANGWTVYYYTHANVIYLNEDSSHMFEWMEMLNNIEWIGNWDSSKVINMSSMFKDTDLESLDLSKWDTSKVTNMSSMFENCSVTDLSLSYGFNNSNYWDTSKVTNMSSMFKWCSNLNNIGVHIMNWDTSKVTDMSSMFDGCKLTGNLNLENWNTSNVTNMSSMFKAYGGGLQYITIYSETYHTGRDTSKVTNMSSMFEGRSALKIIYGIDKLKTSNVTDMNSMFKDCYELSDLLIGNWNTSEVTDMSSMFSLDRKLSKLNLCSWDTSKVTDMTDMFLMCNNDYGGWCSTELQSIAVSESFKTNGVIESSWMFYGADSLSWWNGTKYNPSYTDKTYARIDKAWQPWYFTACEEVKPMCVLRLGFSEVPPLEDLCIVWEASYPIVDNVIEPTKWTWNCVAGSKSVSCYAGYRHRPQCWTRDGICKYGYSTWRDSTWRDDATRTWLCVDRLTQESVQCWCVRLPKAQKKCPYWYVMDGTKCRLNARFCAYLLGKPSNFIGDYYPAYHTSLSCFGNTSELWRATANVTPVPDWSTWTNLDVNYDDIPCWNYQSGQCLLWWDHGYYALRRYDDFDKPTPIESIMLSPTCAEGVINPYDIVAKCGVQPKGNSDNWYYVTTCYNTGEYPETVEPCEVAGAGIDVCWPIDPINPIDPDDEPGILDNSTYNTSSYTHDLLWYSQTSYQVVDWKVERRNMSSDYGKSKSAAFIIEWISEKDFDDAELSLERDGDNSCSWVVGYDKIKQKGQYDANYGYFVYAKSSINQNAVNYYNNMAVDGVLSSWYSYYTTTGIRDICYLKLTAKDWTYKKFKLNRDSSYWIKGAWWSVQWCSVMSVSFAPYWSYISHIDYYWRNSSISISKGQNQTDPFHITIAWQLVNLWGCQFYGVLTPSTNLLPKVVYPYSEWENYNWKPQTTKVFEEDVNTATWWSLY